MNPQYPCRLGSRRSAGFSLVEILTVVGVVSTLMAILLPAVGGARRQARLVQCQSNLKQLGTAMHAYAAGAGGRFPPNTYFDARFWFDRDRIGQHVNGERGMLKGGPFTCPDDDGGRRSYAMNAWASAELDSFITDAVPRTGELWRGGASPTAILLVESWSGWSSGSPALGYDARETVGWIGDTPGRRFGAGGGLAPPLDAGRCQIVNSELAYARHRPPGSKAKGPLPEGAVNVLYADGHVAAKAHDDLADFRTGRSRMDSLWSPLDAALEQGQH